MANEVSTGRRRGIPWRLIGWSIPALLLLLPLVAMQYTDEVNWTAGDFIFATILFGSVGLAFELIVRTSDSLAHRLAAGTAVIGALLTVWVNGAVGMIGSEGNPYNLLFLGVPMLALIGSVLAWFRPGGMALAMVAAAAAQAVLGAVGLSTDPRGGVFSIAFAGLWVLAAALFWAASREGKALRG